MGVETVVAVGAGLAAGQLLPRGGGEGGIATPPPPSPPPNEHDIVDYVNELTGTRTYEMPTGDGRVNKDGIPLKKVTTSLVSRDQGEFAIAEQIKREMSSMIRNVQELGKYNPSYTAPFAGFINRLQELDHAQMQDIMNVTDRTEINRIKNTFADYHKTLNEQNFNQQGMNLGNQLGAMGHVNTPFAIEQRARLEREKTIANQGIDLQAEQYGQQLYQNRLQDYGVRQQARQQQGQTAANQFALEQKAVEGKDNRMRERLQTATGQMQVMDSIYGRYDPRRVALTQGSSLTSPIIEAAGRSQAFAGQTYQGQMQGYGAQLQADATRDAARAAERGQIYGALGGALGTVAGAAAGSYFGTNP